MSRGLLEERIELLEARGWRGVDQLVRRITRVVSDLDAVDYETQTVVGRSLDKALRDVGGAAAFHNMVRGLNRGRDWLERHSLHNAMPQLHRAKLGADKLQDITSIPWGKVLDEVQAIYGRAVRERALELGVTTRKVRRDLVRGAT